MNEIKAEIVRLYGCQADFAMAVGLDESVVSRVIRGRRKLDADSIRRWNKLLKMDVEPYVGRKS